MLKSLLVIFCVFLCVQLFCENQNGCVLFCSDQMITVTGYNSGVVVTDKQWFNDIADEFYVSACDTLFSIGSRSNAGFYYKASFDSLFSVKGIVDELEKEIHVVYAEGNAIFEYYGIDTNDEYAAAAWAPEIVGMNDVWHDFQEFGNDQIVAVLDSGIDLGIGFDHHPDLADNLWTGFGGNHGYVPDSTTNQFFPQDFLGHGTAVAGVIAAKANNEEGMAGIAGGYDQELGCQLMSICFANGPTSSSVIAGMRWAYSFGAKIFNISWGSINNTDMQTLCDFLLEFMEDDDEVALIAATGNDGENLLVLPASMQGVIGVAATDMNDRKAAYSNFSTAVDICAPGGTGGIGSLIDVITTTPQDTGFYYHTHSNWNTCYEFVSGTSFAAPMVTGAVALLKSTFPGITRDEIIQRLQGTADDISAANPENHLIGMLGAGRLNVYRALSEQDHPAYRLSGILVQDNNNNILEVGESNVNFKISLKNYWINGTTECHGTLTTNDPYITINENEGDWDAISLGAEGVCNEFYVTDNSDYPREIEFVLTIEYDGREESLHFNIPCQMLESELVEMENVTVTSELVKFDIDNDGCDEVVFGAKDNDIPTSYYACLFDNNQIVCYAVNDSIVAKPAIADFYYGTSSPDYEVALCTNSGTLYILSSSMSCLYTHSFPDALNALSIGVDDVTNNGQPGIFIVGNKQINNRCIVYYACKRDYPSDLFSTGYSEYSDKRIISEAAIGRVDLTSKKYVLAAVESSDECFEILKFTLCFQQNGVDFDVSDDFLFVVDNSNQGVIDMAATNPVLIQQIYNDDECPYNRIVIGIDKRIEGQDTLPRYVLYEDYYLDCSSENVADILWKNYDPTNSPQDANHDLFEGVNPGKLIAGEFISSNDDIEIFNTNMEQVFSIHSSGNKHLFHITDNYCNDNGGYYWNYRRPSVLTDLNDDGQQELLIADGNTILTYQNREIPLKSYWRVLDSDIVSLSVGSLVSPYEKGIIALTYDNERDITRIYYFPIKAIDALDTDQWQQYLGNERNTGQYLFVFPEIITKNTTIWNDSVVNYDVKIDTGTLVDIMPGVEIRFRYCTMLKVQGSLIVDAEPEMPVWIKGLCPNPVKDHWMGITTSSDSYCSIKGSNISNANIGFEANDNGDYSVKWSKFDNNLCGVSSYNTAIDLGHDTIVNCDYGIVSYDDAVLDMGNVGTGVNLVKSNDYGMFVCGSSPYLDYGNNDFYDNSVFNIDTYMIPSVIKARSNWWGSSSEYDIKRGFGDYSDINYCNWCLLPNVQGGKNPISDTYMLARLEQVNENWASAISLYHEVLADSIADVDDIMSLRGLTSCYKKVGLTAEYIDWISSQIESGNNSTEYGKALLHYWAMNKRITGEYQDAFDYYEDILDGNPATLDSCFAYIDMCHTWFESAQSIKGKYASKMPLSYREFLKESRALLSGILNRTLSQSQAPAVPTLDNIYPNPFNPETTINYYLPSNDDVIISVYNIRGQRVCILTNGLQSKGSHKILWNGRDSNGSFVGSGIYFVRLTSCGKNTVRKVTLIK
jgi:subtilisin family serine protease